MEEDERSGRPRNVVNEEHVEIVREFIRKEPKSSLKYMESELGMSAASIYCILTENLGYIKVCAKFVPHALKPHKTDLTIFDYLTKNHIVTINHSPYWPDRAPCDFYLFGKLNLAMKGKLYTYVDAIQKASTAILNAIPKDDIKKSFLIVQIVVFSAKGTISKATNKMFAKENQFFVFS